MIDRGQNSSRGRVATYQQGPGIFDQDFEPSPICSGGGGSGINCRTQGGGGGVGGIYHILKNT